MVYYLGIRYLVYVFLITTNKSFLSDFCVYCENIDVFCETFIIRNTVFLPRQIGNDNKDVIKLKKTNTLCKNLSLNRDKKS